MTGASLGSRQVRGVTDVAPSRSQSWTPFPSELCPGGCSSSGSQCLSSSSPRTRPLVLDNRLGRPLGSSLGRSEGLGGCHHKSLNQQATQTWE